MTILVTGGAGYIGSHACKALAAAGHTPIAYDDLSTGHRSAVRFGPFEHGSILDTTRLAEVMRRHGCHTVIHFAALSTVGEAATRPDLYWRVNVAGTLALLDAMRLVGINRLVFSSTCAVYGIPVQMPITEATPCAPLNVYGETKFAMERMLEAHANAYGLAAVALRYFNAAGADPDGMIGEEHDPETHAIPLILQTAAGQRAHFTVFGEDYETRDGSCVRDYVHVTDLADAHVRALDVLREGTMDAINLGSGDGFTVREVVGVARQITGREIAVESGPRRVGDPPVLTANATKAEAVLGWTPQHSGLDEIIGTAWRWMSEFSPRR
ncbi:MAG: UDP-glucose 4-epimerase GalE [Pseudomonadota bacterium]